MYEDMTKEELIELLGYYDRYIQDANDEDHYRGGWRRVCISEFYNCDFELLKEEEEL